MKSHALARLFLAGLTAICLTAADRVGPRFVEVSATDEVPTAIPTQLETGPAPVGGYGNLPATFEANRGQAPAEVRYLLRGAGYALLLETERAVLRLADSDSDIVIRFPGASTAEPSGDGLLPGRTNYYRGDDPRSWLRDVPNYESVKYSSLWPGVDLVFYASQARLEYDFVVAPGANTEAIRIAIEGDSAQAGAATGPRIAADGALVLETSAGEFRQEPPVLYQRIDEVRRSVKGRYVEAGGGTFGFEVGDYDRSMELVIDPVLVYSTLMGGGSRDVAFSLAVDSEGAAYITGQTSSRLLPVTSQGGLRGTTDAFVIKLNATGTQRLYSVYYGGSGNDTGWDIEVDSQGRAVFSGTTDSTNLPRQSAFQNSHGGGRDAFAVRLTETGGLIYATYMGGDDRENGYGVASAADGTAYVTGETRSGDFVISAPAAPRGGRDAFVVKISPSGSRLYSQVIGGPGVEGGSDIAVDAAGNVYVAGGSSRDFPSTRTEGIVGSPSDAIFFTLDSSGAPRFSLRLGGSGIEEFFRVAVDSNGEIYLAGFTESTDYPVRNAFQLSYGGGKWDATAVKLSAAGAPIYATYLGGSRADVGFGGALGEDKSFYVTGRTESSNFPVRPNAYQSFFGGGVQDAFLARISASGSELLESTFLGGTSTDEGYNVKLDGSGGVYVAGFTESNNFPTTVGAAQVVQQGGGDAFVVKFSESNCRFALNQSSRIVGALGASDTITVNVSKPDCKWVATADSPFISISGPAEGMGTGSIAFEVAPNSGAGVRRGAILVAGRLVQVTQFGSGCGFQVSPSNATILEAGGERSVFITAAAPECSWSTSTNEDWLSFPAGGSGVGDGVLTLSAAANSTGAGRTADILVGGETLRVSQLSSACEISLSGVGGVRPQGGGQGRVKVIATGATCPWSASALDPWINVTAGQSGAGNGEVVYEVTENSADELRTGSLNVSGQAFTVVQNGEDTPDDNFILSNGLFSGSPLTQRCANISADVRKPLGEADGEQVQLTIQADSDCNWTLLRDNQAMIDFVGSASGSGNGSANVLINPHSGPQARAGRMYVDTGTVSFQEIRIRQRARAGCFVDANPSAANVDAFGESRTLQVDADDNECAWTVSAATENPWIEIPQGVAVGRGDGTVDYTVQANTSRVRREGRILVNQEREITIVQEGQPCDFQLTETERDIGSGPFSSAVGVTTMPSDCRWGVFVNPGSDWIRISGPQTRLGGGMVSFEAIANIGASRTGFVQIASVNYTLRQAGVGVSCELSLSETSRGFGSGGSAGSFNVTATAPSCGWTSSVESGADWIRIVSGLAGTGSAAVEFEIDANPSPSERVGVIRVAGLAFTVQQAGVIVVGLAPEVAPGGAVEAARFLAILTPGGIGTLFGSNFAERVAFAESVPLPTELAGIRVTVNGLDAALFYVDGNQINFQAPTGLPTSGQYTIIVFRNGEASAPVLVDAAEYAPAAYRNGATLETIAVHPDNQLVTPANPIKAGQVFIVYLNGLGGLLNAAPTGFPAGSSPLVTTRLFPSVTLGGAAASVLFSGITPGSVGLGQLNLEAPDPLPPGDMLDLLITYGAAVSPAAPVPVMQPPPSGNDDVAATILGVQPSSARSGDNVRVDYQLSTTTGFRGNVNVEVYVSQDATIQPGVDRRVGSGFDGLLGDSGAFTQFFAVPEDLEPSEYWVGVAVVSPADTNPVNDVSGARRLTVSAATTPATEVTLNSVSPAVAPLRGPIDVDFTLRNNGPEAQVAYFIYLSTDATITADDVLVERGSLLVSGERRLNRRGLELPAGLSPGRYSVGVQSTFTSGGGPFATSDTIAVELAGLSGTLSATPNPIVTCSSTGTTTLSWTAIAVTTTGIHRGAPDGPQVTRGGAAGDILVRDVASGTTFYLQNTSNGLPLTADNTLDTVTVTIMGVDCPPVGGPPPTTELTEGNLNEWDFEAFEGGERTSVAGRTGASGVKVGSDYIVGFTTDGDKLKLAYPRAASGVRVSWDLSGLQFLELWVRGLVGSGELKLGSPVIRLISGAGSRTIRPFVEIQNDDDDVFIFLKVPLDGDSDWIVSNGGFFSITGVTSIELEWESTGPGIQVGVDGLLFTP